MTGGSAYHWRSVVVMFGLVSNDFEQGAFLSGKKSCIVERIEEP
jgi:hypothetical protein